MCTQPHIHHVCDEYVDDSRRNLYIRGTASFTVWSFLVEVLEIYVVTKCAPTAESGGTKHEKFRSLAESRTSKAIESVGRIGNLSNRALYEWDEVEVRKVVKALRDAVAEVEARFASPRSKVGSKFKL